jgi:hypothetical protein
VMIKANRQLFEWRLSFNSLSGCCLFSLSWAKSLLKVPARPFYFFSPPGSIAHVARRRDTHPSSGCDGLW